MQTKCDLCHLGATAFKTVHSVGHDECDLYIIGDYPRQEDDSSGYPMTGSDYKFLWDLLEQMGVKYRVGNTIRCMAVDPSRRTVRRPETTEISFCASQHLFKELEQYKPKAVLLLGQVPIDLILGEGIKIATAREKTGEYVLPSGHSMKVISTYHPSYVLSTFNDMFMRRFIDDVVYSCRHAMEYLSVGKYFSKTVEVNMYEQLVDMWLADESIEYVSFDTESNTLDPLYKGSLITSLSISVDGVIGFNVFLYHPEHPYITDDDRERIRFATERILTNKKVIAQHAKHEHRMLKKIFKFTPNITDDTMYMAYILYMSYPGISYGLKFLAGRFLAMPPWEEQIDRYVSLFKQMKRYKNLDGRVDQLVDEYKDIKVGHEDILRFWSILQDPGHYMKHEFSDDGKDVFMWMIPSRVMEEYAGFDAIAPFHLQKMFNKMLDADAELAKSYGLLMESAEVFANIELKGVRLNDIEGWTERYEKEVEICIQELRRFPEVQDFEKREDIKEYNPNSSKQNAQVFFTYLSMPVMGTTGKGEPSTADGVITDLINKFHGSTKPEDQKKILFLGTFRRYKKLKKLLSSYFIGLKRFAGTNDAFDGHKCLTLPIPKGEEDMHIHPQYGLSGTETGRVSSANPSMHTIPGDSDVKKMIVPHSYNRGGMFVGADQSQLELKVVASIVEKYYGDSSMADAYRRGLDIHTYNASQIFGIPYDDVLDSERKFAKAISFALLYGSSEASVAETTGKTKDEVTKLFSSFFDMFPGIKLYIDSMHRYAQQYGCVRTPMGRIRHLLAALDPGDRRSFGASMRQAQNTPIQSAGSDISLMSIVHMDKHFRNNEMNSKVIAFVHDAIINDVHPGEFIENVKLLFYAMKTLPETELDWLTAPLGVDVEVSVNMGEVVAIREFVDGISGIFHFEFHGHKHVMEDVISAILFNYDILEDTLISEEDDIKPESDLTDKKVHLSKAGSSYKYQVRKFAIIKRV